MAGTLDVLFAVNTIVALWALIKAYPCSFFIVANLAIVARALSNIARYGQPSSQSFLPRYIFGDNHMGIAMNVLAIASAVAFVLVAVPLSSRARRHAGYWPAVPRFVLVAALLYLVLVAASMRTVFAARYSEQQVFDVALTGGGHTLSMSILVYTLLRRICSGWMRPVHGLLICAAVLFLTDYLKGLTGLATGYLLLAGCLFLRQEGGLARYSVKILTLLAAAALSAVVMRGVRVHLHEQGLGAVSSYVTSLTSVEGHTATAGEGIERTANGTQYACHMLECIDLYERGISRSWASIYRPIEYTFKPAPLLSALGLSRSPEAAWELMDHFIHGGGIFVLGELYWNGGYLCVFVMMLFFVGLAKLCDERCMTSPAWALVAICYGGTLLMGFGYGVAQIMRGLINSVGLLAAFWLYSLVRRSSSLEFDRDTRETVPALGISGRLPGDQHNQRL